MRKFFTYMPLLKRIACSVILMLSSISIYAQSVTVNIAQPYNDTLLCVGKTFVVNITSNDTFNIGNIFKVELSNATGSFSTPVQIGFKADFLASPVTCTIPTSTIPGTGYRIRVKSTDPGYTSSDNGKNIRISAIPISTLSSNSPLCVGDMLQLNVNTTSSNPSFSWTGPNGFSANLKNPVRNGTGINDSGYYHVTTTSYKCSSIDSIKIEVVPQPMFTLVYAPPAVCQDATLDINTNTNLGSLPTYTIYKRGNPNPIAKQPNLQNYNSKLSDSGYYDISAEVGSCRTDTNVYIIVKPLPDTPVANGNSPLCVGDTLTLSGNSSTPAVSYRWEGPNGFTDTGSSIKRPNIQNNDAGYYILYAVKNGCDSKPDTVDVKVGIPLVALDIKGDSLLCPGDRLSLQAQTSVTSGVFWYKLPDLNIPISTNRSYGVTNVAATDAGTYAVTQEVNGCRAPLSTVTVKIPDIKDPGARNNGPLCIGQILELSATPTNNGTYEWTGPNGFTSTVINPVINNVDNNHEGPYSIKTTLENCSLSSNTEVIIKPMPEITTISSNSPVCSYTQLLLEAESSLSNSEFEWTGPNGYTAKEQNPSVYFEDDRSGTYSVKAIADGCVSESKSVEVETKEGPGETKISNNGPLREGDRLLLTSTNDKFGVTYYWEGPDGFTSDLPNPIIDEVTYRNAGTYKLTTIYNDCSTIVTTIVNIENISGITAELFPNPNNGKFTVRGITQTDATLDVVIYNQLGRVVYRDTATPDKSKYSKTIDINGSATGVYLIYLSNNSEEKRIQFAVVKQ